MKSRGFSGTCTHPGDSRGGLETRPYCIVTALGGFLTLSCGRGLTPTLRKEKGKIQNPEKIRCYAKVTDTNALSMTRGNSGMGEEIRSPEAWGCAFLAAGGIRRRPEQGRLQKT